MRNTNPFVEAAFAVISDTVQTARESVSLESLATRIGEVEPMLSNLNCGCVAREALRQWPAHEAARAAQEEAWRALFAAE